MTFQNKQKNIALQLSKYNVWTYILKKNIKMKYIYKIWNPFFLTNVLVIYIPLKFIFGTKFPLIKKCLALWIGHKEHP